MPAEADELPPEVTEERADEGEGDWLKAVEDALKAATGKRIKPISQCNKCLQSTPIRDMMCASDGRFDGCRHCDTGR